MVERYYNEKNELAVLTCYGGWSIGREPYLAYDKRIVEYFLENNPNYKEMEGFIQSIGYDYKINKYDYELRIEWVPKGTPFFINEYDGNEYIVVNDYVVIA